MLNAKCGGRNGLEEILFAFDFDPGYILLGKPSITFYANRMLIGHCVSSGARGLPHSFIYIYYHLKKIMFS